MNKEAPALVETDNSHKHHKQVSYTVCYKVKRRSVKRGSRVRDGGGRVGCNFK